MTPFETPEGTNGPFARAKPTAERQKARRRRWASKPATPSVKAIAVKHYLCLLIEEGKIAQLQLTLRADLTGDARTGLMALFRSARVMAFFVDSTTMLMAAGVPMACAFAEHADGQGVLGRRLKSRLNRDFGAQKPALTDEEQERMRLLGRAFTAIRRVDLPAARAFADAGFDLSTIYSSRQSR